MAIHVAVLGRRDEGDGGGGGRGGGGGGIADDPKPSRPWFSDISRPLTYEWGDTSPEG